MEKLQAALDKARKSRIGNANSNVADSIRAADGTDANGDVAGLWAALPAIELREAGLLKHRVVTRTARQEATPFDILRTKALLLMRKHG